MFLLRLNKYNITDFTEEDFGIYVELVYHYDRYLKDKYNTDDALSASSLDRTYTLALNFV